MSVVASRRIEEVADREKWSLDDIVKVSDPLYEAGMDEVLKEVALAKLDASFEDFKSSNATFRALEAAEKIFETVASGLTEEQQDLLRQFDDSHSYHTSLESADHFVWGFIQGYKFLKALYVHRPETDL